ncbi:MAG: molybdopterin-binding protein, partial [Candidatus Bathyarchaeia archaeon]
QQLDEALPKICIEIFAIGNELCYGKIYDTNSFWIAEQVTQLGANVQRITCIPDDIDTICCGLSEALSRNPQFIILTGGLGPTSDDLTIEALSKLFNSKITIDKEILKLMAERRKTIVEQLPPHLVKMLRTLEGAECLPNPLGWAPVTVIQKGETMIFALPGPPKEAKACFVEYLARRIRERTGRESESQRVFVNMYESQVSPITDEIMKSMPGVYLKPLVSEYQTDKGLPIEIIAFAENREACQKKIMEIIERLEKLVNSKKQ